MEKILQFSSESPSPWLLYGHKNTQTLYSVSYNQKSSLQRIPELRNKVILNCSHGWLVIRDRSKYTLFSFYNPLTLELINLPPLPLPLPLPLLAPPEKTIPFLMLPPDSHDCLFLLSFDDKLLFSCSPSKPNCTWLTQPLQLDGESFSICDTFTLHHDHDHDHGHGHGHCLFYANLFFPNASASEIYQLNMCASNSLITFTPWLQMCSSEHFGPINLSYGIRSSSRLYLGHRYLIESCGRVYLVCLCCEFTRPERMEEPVAIRVLELDSCKFVWKEINSLDGRSFFLGFKNSSWCWGNTNSNSNDTESGSGIQSNCVYFLLSNYNVLLCSLYIYNLIDQTFMRLRSCPDLLMPRDPPVWLIPQHQRLLSKNNKIVKKVDQGVLQHNERQGQLTRFMELPTHMIECISNHMHLFEYWNFRASCKEVRSLCPAPRWRTNNAPPLLVIFKNINSGSSSCKLIDPVRCDSRFSVLPFSPYPCTLLYSNNGWLLTLVDEKQLHFFNLFTGAKGKFPPCFDHKICFRCAAFSTYPTDPNCWIVGIDNPRGGGVFIYLLSSKRRARQSMNQAWGSRHMFNGHRFTAAPCHPVFVGGAFNFLSKEGYLGVFQWLNGTPTWNTYEKPQTLKQFHSCSLVECQGKLYSVFIETVGKWIQVFRFDESAMSWVEIKGLDDCCFFISNKSSISVVTRDPKMRNRLYLARVRHSNVIYYSLDSRKFHICGSDEPLEDLFGTTAEPLNCCWM